MGCVENVEALAAKLGYKIGSLPSSYLGLRWGAPYKSVATWDEVEERFRKRLARWKSQYISKRTRNPHLIYNFLSYHRLSSPYSAFVSTISSVSLPKSTPEALSHSSWRQAMVDEMAALHSNGTWDLVVLPSGKSTIGCRWVYTVNVGPDGQVDRLKVRLVAEGYT